MRRPWLDLVIVLVVVAAGVWLFLPYGSPPAVTIATTPAATETPVTLTPTPAPMATPLADEEAQTNPDEAQALFTDNAFLALRNASRSTGGQEISSMHLLAGVKRVPDWTSDTLSEFGVDSVDWVSVTSRVPGQRLRREPPLSDEVKDIIGAAVVASSNLGEDEIDTDHLILGMLATDCEARRYLNERGITYDQFYELVKKRLRE